MNIFSKLSQISRDRKLVLFNEIIRPTKETKVLDVGGVSQNSNKKLHFIDIYPWKHKFALANISEEYISAIKKRYLELETVVCDACELPWPDKSFDVVFSNVVIEHLGSFERTSGVFSRQ